MFLSLSLCVISTISDSDEAMPDSFSTSATVSACT